MSKTASLPHSDLVARLEQSIRYLEVLRQASLHITSSLDLQEVLYALLESAFKLLGDTRNANIFFYENDRLLFGAAIWEGGRLDTPFAEPRQDGLTYTVARGGENVAVEDMSVHALFQTTPKEWNGAIIGLPLKYGGKVLGVMNISWPHPRRFDEEELHAIALLADQAAIAIENARLHRVVRAESLTDALTGLPNRRAFDARLAEEVRRSTRYGHTFELLIIDLDRFKRINDTHGHVAGDRALTNIAGCLRSAVRDTDFLARYGGDEFVLILPETKIGDEEIITKKLRTAAEECWFDLPGMKTDAITLSIGAAYFPDDAREPEELIHEADKDLYERKGHA